MAITSTPAGLANNQFRDSASPTDFVSWGDFIQYVNEPQYAEKIKQIYMQELGITELLSSLGSEFAVGRDTENFWFEQGRRFVDGAGTIGSTSPTDTATKVIADADHKVRNGDDVIINGEIRGHVTTSNATTFTVAPYTTTWGVTFTSNQPVNYFVSSNEHAKASDQQTQWLQPNVDRHEAKLAIMKDIYKMSGSQMTDKSWVNIGGKDAYIYLGEEEGFKRFKAYEEMKMVYGTPAENTTISSTLNGTEGLFDALEKRGNVWGGYIQSLSDIDDITEALDTESGESAMAAYVNSRQFNYLQDMVADNVGLAAYGMFDNGKEDAIKFGFSGIMRSGYEIMFHKWNLLTNPQLGGKDKVFKGVMFPLGEMRDAETGMSIPCLSVLYKELNGYSRKFESWLTGAANGTYTDSSGNDSLTVNYRSEKGMRVAGANRFVLIK